MNHETQPLYDAYLQTTYTVETASETIKLRINKVSPALNALLRQHRANEWAFITAYNPRSQILTPEENQARQKRLIAELETRGYCYLFGQGIGDAETWQPEASVFIFNIRLDDALRLARQFEQNAILAGRAEDAPQLVWASSRK